MEALIKKVNKNNNLQFNKMDFILCMVVALICVLFFNHQDILITAQRSTILIKDWNILDNFGHFYSNSHAFAGDTGANYLISTFLIFAIWNIPLRLFGLTSYVWGEWGVFFGLWNKLLPILAYMASGFLVYKICKQDFQFSHAKSKTAMFLFLTSPIAFLSQFLFCQYDIFTVFFMLLGMHYYFKEDRSQKDFLKFILFFGIAFTLKYYSILFFVILLLLDTKKVIEIIKAVVITVIPAGLEVVIYYLFDKEKFVSQVFGFKVLDYVQQEGSGSSILSGWYQFNIMYVLLCIVLFVAYLKKAEDKADKFRCFLQYSCAVCAILFSLMIFHPQWLLIGVFFWTLLVCISEHYQVLLILDVVFAYAFYGCTTNLFVNNVDQSLMKYGVLQNLLRYRVDLNTSITMKKYFSLKPELMFTIMVCIFIFYIMCGNSKYCFKNVKTELSDIKFLGYFRYFFAVLMFVVPAVLSGAKLFQQPEKIWVGYISNNPIAIERLDISKAEVEQEIKIDEEIINYIDIYTSLTSQISEDMQMEACILNSDKEEIASATISGSEINRNGFSRFEFGGVDVSKEKKYYIVVKGNSNMMIDVLALSSKDNMVKVDLFGKIRVHDTEKLFYDSQEKDKLSLKMSIYGN